MFSLNATLPVFLVMVIGWALGQKGFLPKQFCTVADKLVFKVTLPVMLFCDMATLDLAHSFDAKFVLFCFAVTAIAIVVIWVLARRLLKDKTLVGEFVQASYRSSAAILGVAFIQNIYGTSGMAPLMILGSVPLFNIFAVIILTVESPQQHGKVTPSKLLYGVLTNPHSGRHYSGYAVQPVALWPAYPGAENPDQPFQPDHPAGAAFHRRFV